MKKSKMKNAYNKEILRSIRKGKKRFISIMIITILGVVMLTGLRAACVDLRTSANEFYNAQKLFDVSVMSTLGLTEEDVQALGNVTGVELAEGTYTKTVYTIADNKKQSVEVRTISTEGINEPYVVEGNLPTAKNEIAVTEKYINQSGKQIGDTLSIDENEKDKEDENHNFVSDTFTITAIVTDVCDVNVAEGPVSFRSNSMTDYTFFVSKEAVQSELYTAIYMRVSDADELMCYSKPYEAAVTEVKQTIEDEVMQQREEARTESIRNDAQEELDSEKSDAEEKVASKEAELEAASINTNMPYAQYVAAKQELSSQKESMKKKFEEAQKEIDDMESAKWYIQDRSSLSGYENIKSDASSIEAIGTVFPIVFFIVAILISLTTITRLVEEERGLIGTYKALGFTDREIRRKYMIFAAGASVTGGIIGNLGGFILLPKVIFTIFATMYELPAFYLTFEPIYGIGGMMLFVVGITGATIIACEATLHHVPAALMRPKSPRVGQKVLLERIGWLWRRMSFLNKVTARNLFRYKKRLFMTVFGIMGCTALVLCGFAIKDSVTELMPAQYDHIYDYDLLAVTTAEDNDKLLSYVSDDKIKEYINVGVSSVKLKTDSGEENLQVIVVPDQVSLNGYIHLDKIGGGTVDIEESKDGIVVTRNASQVLEFEEGDRITIQDQNLNDAQVTVNAIVENYLGNMVYMTQSVYEEVFGTYEPNGILANFSESCSNQSLYAEELGSKEGVISSVSTESLKNEFSSAFAMINMVVYIIIIMAAGLAFVVLFTLSNTNISERIRELSTIKVLGFYDNEVHLYVNKETLILTGIGVILGLPCGAALGHALTDALRMPSINFAVVIHPFSFLLAAIISFGFAIIVDMITNRILDKIDPVEALKSIE